MTTTNTNTRTRTVPVSRADFMTEAERNEQIIAQHESNVAKLGERVLAIKNAKLDAVANTRAMTATPIEASDNAPATVVFDLPRGLRATIGDVAHEQLSYRLKIDLPYYRRMISEAPQLLAENLNWWLQNTPNDHLLRMLQAGPALGEDETRRMHAYGARVKLRAVLGKSYRTIDDADLVASIMPELEQRGTLLQEFSIDDRRMHAKFVAPAVTLERPRVRGEVVSRGIYIRHSEIGFASLTASTFMLILKCVNGMVGEDAISIRHVGKRREVGDVDDMRMLSDSTQIMENAALLGRVRDAIGNALAPETIAAQGEKLLTAKETVIERSDELPLFEFVGNLGASLGLNETNIEQLKEETVKSIQVEGAETHFAFVQGITAVARQMTNYDARTDLEHAGFQLLNDDPSKLLQLASGNTQKRSKRAVARILDN